MKHFWMLLFLSSPVFAKAHPFVGLGMGRMNETKEMHQSASQMAFIGSEWGHLGVQGVFLNVSQSNKNQTLLSGELSVTPILLNLYLRVPVSKRWIVNVGGGGGYVMTSHYLDPSITETHARFGERIWDDVKDGFGLNAMGSFEYRATRSFSVQAQVIHLFYETTVKTSVKRKTYDKTQQYLGEYVVVQPLDLEATFIFLNAKYRW